MTCQEYIPDNKLKEYVKYMWSMDHNIESKSPCTERIIPSGCVELLFNFGDRIKIKSDNGVKRNQPLSAVSGQKTRFTDLQTSGNIGFFLVVLRPSTARGILGLPIKELQNKQLDLEDIVSNDVRQLTQQINESSDNQNRFRIIQDFLQTRIRQNKHTPDERIKFCVQNISLSGGNTSVSDLASKANVSIRQLERLFASHVGLSPKEFSKIIRFQHTLAIKQKDPSFNLTALAYEKGFSDQAHFIHDFKSITGITPKAYFQECPPISDYYTYP